MKNKQRLAEFRDKTEQVLQEELLSIRKEQFNLRTQQITRQLTQTHLFRQKRRDIARIKTVLKQKQTMSETA